MVPLQKEAMRWFDYWLKRIDNGIQSEPRCRMFLMGAGANRWIEADTFPVAEGRSRVFYLGADGGANSLLGAGKLGNVLVFTSEPLTRPLNVVGMLTADLYVSTSAVDTDFVARLSDVGPDGYAQRLNAGIVRLRYREGYDQIKLVQPGEVVKVEVDMWATGHQFQPGHRVRLEVTSSAFPTWAPNYNTGGSVWEETEPVGIEEGCKQNPSGPLRET